MKKRLFNSFNFWPKKDEYIRFKKANASVFHGMPESTSRIFGLIGVIGFGTFAYVQLNQDTVPISGRRRFMTIDKKTENYYGKMVV